MVSSGLADRVEVAPQRLATHLVLAALTLVALVAIATRLEPGKATAAPARLRHGASLLVVLVLGQLALGALVAGARAGYSYNTWPLMEGRFIPPLDQLFRIVADLAELSGECHDIAVRPPHDGLLHLGAGDLAACVRCDPTSAGDGAVARRALVLAGLALCQAGLGIATLVLVVPLGLPSRIRPSRSSFWAMRRATACLALARLLLGLARIGCFGITPPASA